MSHVVKTEINDAIQGVAVTFYEEGIVRYIDYYKIEIINSWGTDFRFSIGGTYGRINDARLSVEELKPLYDFLKRFFG